MPVRGTQSFVGVMADVWKRPSLTGVEVLWRWVVGIPLVLLAWAGLRVALGSAGVDVQLHASALSSITVFRPAEALTTLHELFGTFWPVVGPLLLLGVPLLMLVWAVAFALGRTAVLRRVDPKLAPRRPTLAVLALLKLSKLVAMFGSWIGCWGLGLKVAVTGPAQRQQEPNLVLLAALLIGLTLLLFVVWSATNWVLQLAPLIAMVKDVSVRKSLVHAIRAPKQLRSKLIEINLVMGIVKVALIVLAMVFSACPLPFASVETQSFLMNWWTGVGVAWLLMSDYFHVVRAVAYLRLWRAYEFAEFADSSGFSTAGRTLGDEPAS